MVTTKSLAGMYVYNGQIKLCLWWLAGINFL